MSMYDEKPVVAAELLPPSHDGPLPKAFFDITIADQPGALLLLLLLLPCAAAVM